VGDGGLKTRDLTSRDHQNCGDWHRETGQRGIISQGWTSRDLFQCSSRCSLYKFMFDSGSIIWAAHRFYVCSSVSFCFTYCYVRQTKLTSSLDNIWANYKIVIDCASSCILSTCSMSARHQCAASTWRHDAHFATVVRGCCCGCRCRFRRTWSWRCWHS